MQPQARELFLDMMQHCGEDIVRMEASFEMYLAQYLADYPEEKQLLRDAFKVGIPLKILQHAEEADYEQYLEKLGPRFAEAAQRDPEECRMAVVLWAEALGRTADYVPPPKPDEIFAHVDAQSQPTNEVTAKTMMAIIVTTGGILGSGLAAIFFPLVLWGMNFSAVYFAPDGEGGTSITSDQERWIYFGLTFFIAGVVGGFGALGGWLFGRGSEDPWAGFSVAFGSGLTMFFILSVIPSPFIPSIAWKPIALMCSVFAAVYKTAARGGYY